MFSNIDSLTLKALLLKKYCIYYYKPFQRLVKNSLQDRFWIITFNRKRFWILQSAVPIILINFFEQCSKCRAKETFRSWNQDGMAGTSFPALSRKLANKSH